MADRRRDRTTRLGASPPTNNLPQIIAPSAIIAAQNVSTGVSPLVAAAQVIDDFGHGRPVYSESWQDEAWDFYHGLGEFNYGVEWFSEALSRVRLNAAVVTSGGDEPMPLTEGPAAEIMSQLAGGPAGQSQLLRSLGVQLSVPGDGYIVGRVVSESDVTSGVLLDATPDDNGWVWTIQPAETIRRRRRGFGSMFRRSQGDTSPWEIQIDDTLWASLPGESLVCRVWERDERMPWRAMSPARAALPIMREIDMYNRYIVATLVSRIALNGIFLIPDEVTFPANPAYENATDPFVAELLDIMRSAIKNPGSPASAAPMPLRVPSEYIEKFRHMTFATQLDQKIFDHREQAIRRLATTLNLPAEIVTGMGDVNHWSSWQLGEDAIKIHIAPKAEIITRALTVGYLYPLLDSIGESRRTSDGDQIIVWYDTSELTQRPDRSSAAIQLRQMKIINDTATRRENGFDESDAPTDAELEKMILTDLAVNPQTAAPALKELTGLDLQVTPPQAPPGGEPMDQPGEPLMDALDEAEDPDIGPPDTQGEPPPPPNEGLTSSARRDSIIQRTHSLRRRAVTRVGGRR